MAISGYTEQRFGEKVASVVNPATPIRSIEHLKGRDEQLREIERALFQNGRHIFVFGDRGVGKSSLAATAAYQYQSSDGEPIFVSGSPDESFRSIIANIAIQALRRSKFEHRRTNESRSIRFRGVEWTAEHEVSTADLCDQIRTIGDATELLKQVSLKHSIRPAVILDEFDTIPNAEERAKFTALLKQLADQTVNIRFFITGIGQSCRELLGASRSAIRQLATIELSRLGFEGRREIVQDAADAFELGLDDNVNWRIALISDGFPYYVHLLTEKMLWAAFDAEKEVRALGWPEFSAGLRTAVQETNAELQRPYQKCVLGREPKFEDVVWSTADSDELLLSIENMYLAYKRIVSSRDPSREIDRNRYSDMLRKLRSPNYGSILRSIAGRQGWYEYSEKMLRGYVRMQAEANGVLLTGERASPKQRMHIVNNRTGYRGPSIPEGVHLNSWPEMKK